MEQLAEAEQIGGAEPPTARADTLTNQSHSRGAEDAADGTEAVRRARASPTPTGCTRATQSARSGTDDAMSGEGHPQHQQRPEEGGKSHREDRRTRHTLTASQKLTEGTGRATGHDRRHRVRSIHPPHTVPTEGAQMPHRARSGARGTATHPPRQESHSRPG